MYISNQKILSIKFLLSDTSKIQLASKLCVDPAVLSREIKNKDLLQRIEQYFDEINPEINKLTDLLLSKNRDLEKSERSIVSEPTFEYKSKNDFLNEKIELLEKIIKEKERVIASQERTIYLYEKNILKPER